MKQAFNKNPVVFVIIFCALFALFYYFNLFFIGITAPGNQYSSFLDEHLNYVRALRVFLINGSAEVLRWFGYQTLTNEFQLMVVGRGIIRIVYTCLGLGLMSFFAAFVIAFPKNLKPKIIFLISGLIIIQLLNILRFVLLVLFWKKKSADIVDHHTLFNLIIYLLIAVSLYFWVTHSKPLKNINAKN